MRRSRVAIAALTTAGLAGAALALAAPASTPTIRVTEKEWKVTRAPLTLVHGRSYVVSVHNTGRFRHDLLVDGHGLDDVGIHNRAPISPGKSKTFTIKFPRAGTYELYCAIPGHKARGMLLKVTVR